MGLAAAKVMLYPTDGLVQKLTCYLKEVFRRLQPFYLPEVGGTLVRSMTSNDRCLRVKASRYSCSALVCEEVIPCGEVSVYTVALRKWLRFALDANLLTGCSEEDLGGLSSNGNVKGLLAFLKRAGPDALAKFCEGGSTVCSELESSSSSSMTLIRSVSAFL